MYDSDEFKKYATKHLGISSLSLHRYNSMYSNYISPTIIEERQMNVASMDIFSRLMMDRIIFLGVPIDDNVSNIIQGQLLFLESTDAKKDIQIYMNSPGGSVYAGLGMMIRCNTSVPTSPRFVREWQPLWPQYCFARVLKENEPVFHTLEL